MMQKRSQKAKRTRSTSALNDTASSKQTTLFSPILALPEELLQRILCNLPLSLERWSDLASTCRQWRHTMQKLVRFQALSLF